MMIVEVIESVHAVAGVALNLMLLYLIPRFSHKSMGTYKYLLSIFAAYDTFLVLLHEFVGAKVVIVNTTFGVVADSLIENRVLTSSFSSCFTVPFILLCIHFLYRFWSVRMPHLISLFSNWKFICSVIAMTISELILWFLLCVYGTDGGLFDIGTVELREEFNRTYGRVIMDGWMRDGKFQLKYFLTLLTVDVVIGCSFSFALTLASLTFYYIKIIDKISVAARRLQWKLFIAVCAQTFVPLVFVYIPYGCTLNFPFLGIPIHPILVRLCTPLISCFPAWDAIIIMVIIKDYRIGLMRIVCRRSPNTTSASTTTSSAVESNFTTVNVI